MTRTVLGMLLLMPFLTSAQSAIRYQGVAFLQGDILADQTIALRFDFRSGPPDDSLLYSESHIVTTYDDGSFDLELGRGAPIINSFDQIVWEDVMIYLQVSLDPSAGTDYQNVGEQELLSVPFAFHAHTASYGPTGPQGPEGPVPPLSLIHI